MTKELRQLKEKFYFTSAPRHITSKREDKILFKQITAVNAELVLRVRNAANVIDVIDTEAITLDDHRAFIESYMDLPRIDFMLIDAKTATPIGGLNLVQTSLGLEIGKYIGVEEYLGRGIAKRATKSFLSYLSSNLPKGTSILSKTKKANTVNIAINQSLGFSVTRDHDDVFLIMEKSL